MLPCFSFAAVIFDSVQNPALMHASLAVALVYDQFLHDSPGDQRTAQHYHHWTQSITLFNKSLSGSILEIDKDSLWGTAAALGVLSFACPEIQKRHDLDMLHKVDLEWSNMDRGKMSLWFLVDPMRPDSIFNIMADTYAQMREPVPDRGAQGISEPLAILCCLDDMSTSQNNPYFMSVHVLNGILALLDGEVTVGHTERFAHTIQGPFRCLLEEMDPTALVLLYLWYHKAGRSIWWIQLRARVDCPSIYTYLERHHNWHIMMLKSLLDPSGLYS